MTDPEIEAAASRWEEVDPGIHQRRQQLADTAAQIESMQNMMKQLWGAAQQASHIPPRISGIQYCQCGHPWYEHENGPWYHFFTHGLRPGDWHVLSTGKCPHCSCTEFHKEKK